MKRVPDTPVPHLMVLAELAVTSGGVQAFPGEAEQVLIGTRLHLDHEHRHGACRRNGAEIPAPIGGWRIQPHA